MPIAVRAAADRRPLKPIVTEPWTPIIPALDAPALRYMGQVARYEYRDSSGALWGFIDRRVTSTGKILIPRTWCQHKVTGARSWRPVGFPSNRPMYGLTQLLAHPTARVLICEGEKCVDAANKVFKSLNWPWVSVTSCGGAGAWQLTDWSPLVGRVATAWRDNDEAGLKYISNVANALAKLGAAVRVLALPPKAKPKWDCADAVDEDAWWPEQFVAFIAGDASAACNVRDWAGRQLTELLDQNSSTSSLTSPA
jgi:putative DNA primase/helicase